MFTPEIARACRAILDQSQSEAATTCGVGLNAVNRAERGHSVKSTTWKALREGYYKAGVRFLEIDGILFVGLKKAE